MSNEVEDIYLLSPMQQGMLFHTLCDPGTQAYFSQSSWTLRADLNATALRAACQAVIDRHPILRSSYLWEGRAKPLQLVWRRVEVPFAQLDWREMSAPEQEKQFASYLLEDQHRGFVLSEAPLIRHALIRLSDDTYKFVWSNHHILLDGWSSFAVLKEVLMTYEALCHDRRLEIAPPRPFRDYIAWLRGQDMVRAEEYWREYLAGISNPTLLKDFSAPALRASEVTTNGSGGYGHYQSQLTPAATQALKVFARRHQLTLNTVFQGAWALLLSHYTRQREVVFGSVVSGRPTALNGVEEMVGLFINTLPVRVKVDRELPVAEWLRRLQARQVEMRSYEYSPLVEVQRWCEVPAGGPLFDSILVFENFPIDEVLRVGSGEFEISDIRSLERTSYPLALSVGPGEERITLLASYQENCFNAQTIQRLVGHLKTLLEGMAANPLLRPTAVPFLGQAELNHLLTEWNATKADYPLDNCLHELFEQQVARMPDRIAVSVDDQRLTFSELNARANQLAHYLKSLGVGPDSLIGIFVERSIEMVVGLLGILKAGGAYVPLDPTYPQDRLAFMLVDARIKIIVTQQHLIEKLPEHSALIVSLDSEWGEIAKESGENLEIETRGEHLAYVIYTSGSTGRPKGAMIPHRAIVNHMLWMGEQFPLSERDRVLQKTAFSFDASVWEFYAPLLSGAKLVMAGNGVAQDAGLLARVLRDEAVTVLQGVPSLLRLLVAEPELRQCHGQLRRIFSGGEALTAELAAALREATGAEVINLYGPTETTIDATAARYQGESEGQGASVPIGRPVANMRAYIVNEEMELAPAGVAGELYLGGAGVGRGYLHRPELTAERFVPDPFSGESGGRLYRTGDLVRYLADGAIEYLGRNDHQLKLRGFRIELGEIEAVLEGHPAVSRCVAIVRDELARGQRLVTYLVPEAGRAIEISGLRQHLRERLPEYMVPSAFVVMEELPLQPNGKIDRKQLPAPELNRDELPQPFTPPRSELERQIATIWTEVLQVEQVGLHDNFFDLGGHSLLLLQAHGKLRETLQTDLSLMEMFQYPTIHAMAERLGNPGSMPDNPGKGEADLLESLAQGKNRLRQQYQQRQAAMEG